MKAYSLFILLALMAIAASFAIRVRQGGAMGKNAAPEYAAAIVQLPQPRFDSGTSVEKALLRRRSVREYRDEPLTLAEVGQLLWAAQGVTAPGGFRTAPSAGALYPLELYLVAASADSKPGVSEVADGIGSSAICVRP